jgi:hypothetical protein
MGCGCRVRFKPGKPGTAFHFNGLWAENRMKSSMVAILRRQLAEHERAAAEIRQLLEEGTIDGSQPNGADLDDLRIRCREAGIEIIPGDLVSEKDAARLISRSPKTLRNWRYLMMDGQLPFEHFAGRIVYRLEDLADFIRKSERPT